MATDGIIEGSNFRFARSLTVARIPKPLPVSELTPVQQQKQSSDGEAHLQLIQPFDDGAMSARRWFQQTIQEITDYDSVRWLLSAAPYP